MTDASPAQQTTSQTQKPSPLSNVAFAVMAGWVALQTVYFRFANITTKGLFFPDEGWYDGVARTYLTLPAYWWGLLTGADREALFEELFSSGYNPRITYKPGFQLFLISFKALLGPNKDYAGLAMTATFGSLSVLLLYFLTKKLTGNRWIGLLAAFLLSLSQYHIIYSRNQLTNGTTVFFVLLFALLYLNALGQNATRRAVYWAGLGLGYVLTTHDSMMPFVLVALLFELGYALSQNGLVLKEKLRRFWVFLGGALTFPLFWEVTTWVLGLVLKLTTGHGLKPYFKQMIDHLDKHKPLQAGKYVSHTNDYGYFWKLLLITDGWPVLALLTVGLGYYAYQSFIKRNIAYFFISYLTGFGLLLSTLYHAKRMRLFASYVPLVEMGAAMGVLAVALMGAFALRKLLNEKNNLPAWTRAVSVSALSVLMAGWLALRWESTNILLSIRSSYGEAARWMTARLRPGEKIISDRQKLVLSAYAGGRVTSFKREEQFDKLIASGEGRFLIVDFLAVRPNTPQGDYLKVERLLKPAAVFSNPFPENLLHMAETSWTLADIDDALRHHRRTMATIRVYDLAQLRELAQKNRL